MSQPRFFSATIRPRVVLAVTGAAVAAALLATGDVQIAASLAPRLVPILLLLAGYFLPAIVAQQRRHHNAAAILMLDLLLGWTGLGWIIALVWAMTAVRR